jgi:N-methylhydantoinase B/oxoprolinase/acetone carboxylase alpha subunit
LNTQDGTGHGKFRGGFGMIKDYKLLADRSRVYDRGEYIQISSMREFKVDGTAPQII